MQYGYKRLLFFKPGFVIRNRNEDIKHNKTGTYVQRHSTAMVIRQVYVKCLF